MSDSEREMLYRLLGEAVALMPTDSAARQQWLRDVLHETESVHAPRPSLFERREEDLFDHAENLDRCPPTSCDAFSAEIREMAESDA